MINFFDRNSIGSGCSKINKNDYVGFINLVQSVFPNLYPNPESLLYKLAITQLEKTIINSTERPPIPSWVCGSAIPKLNNISQNLVTQSNFFTKREAPVLDSLEDAIEASNEILFPADNCLVSTGSLPGSTGYLTCNQNVSALDFDIQTIDRATSFYPIDNPYIYDGSIVSPDGTITQSASGGGMDSSGHQPIRNPCCGFLYKLSTKGVLLPGGQRARRVVFSVNPNGSNPFCILTHNATGYHGSREIWRFNGCVSAVKNKRFYVCVWLRGSSLNQPWLIPNGSKARRE